jgi:hypothetical protein
MRNLRLLLPLVSMLIAVAAPAAPASAAASADADPLTFSQARAQIRTATEMWAGLLDGRAHVGRCERSGRAIRCAVVIRGARTRCEMRVSVSRKTRWDTLRARNVRCADIPA